ncbi:MAG: PDZ domain-containing protein [Rubripirellula sp.]
MLARFKWFVVGCLLIGGGTVDAQGVDFREAIKTVAPASVSVAIEPGNHTNMPMELNNLHGQWMQHFAVKTPIRSGVAISRTMIVSCGIPVGQTDIEVRTSDGSKLPGKVVSRDHATGAVVIVVDDTGTDGVAMNTETPEAGLPVVISWLEQGKWPTCESAMIASGLTNSASWQGVSQRLDADFVEQKIGAPVMDANGKLVGLFVGANESALLPASTLSRLIEAASGDEPSDLQRGQLGVQLGGDDSSTVIGVMDDSPAAKAGVEPGDVITKVGDIACEDATDVIVAVSQSRAGDSIKVDIQRDGETIAKNVELLAMDLGTRMPGMQGTPGPGVTHQQFFAYKDGKLVPIDPKTAHATPGLPGMPVLPFGPAPPNIPGAPSAPGAPPALDAPAAPGFDALPRQWIQGRLQVERSKLEDAMKRLEAAKKQQDKSLKALREKIAELESNAERHRAGKLDLDRVNKSLEEIKERLQKAD